MHLGDHHEGNSRAWNAAFGIAEGPVVAVRRCGSTTEWSFTGEQHDATGLEYLRARYYDASTGWFLSQDPMPLLVEESEGIL